MAKLNYYSDDASKLYEVYNRDNHYALLMRFRLLADELRKAEAKIKLLENLNSELTQMVQEKIAKEKPYETRVFESNYQVTV